MKRIQTILLVSYFFIVLAILQSVQTMPIAIVGLFIYGAVLQLPQILHVLGRAIVYALALLLFLLFVPKVPLYLLLLAFPFYTHLLFENNERVAAVFFALLSGAMLYFLIRQTELPVILLFLFTLIFIGWLYLEKRKRQEVEESLHALFEKGRSQEEREKSAAVHSKNLRELYTTEERNRISRDLHDSIGHKLSAIRFQLSAISAIAEKEPAKASQMASNLSIYAEEGLQELRNMVHQMKPPQYEQQVLLIKLLEIGEDFETMSGLRVRLIHSENKYVLSNEKQQLLILAFQEFLANALRHGKSKHVDANLQFGNKYVVFTLRDDGVGADVIRKNLGLKGMEERAAIVGGRVSYETSPGHGFLTQILIPKEDTHD